MPEFEKVVIFGTGLIGGSFALGLKEAGAVEEVVGFGRTPATLRKAQELDRQPAFYNSLTSNCTTIVWALARSINADLPLDWRLLASGYLAGYLHQLGALAPGHEQAELQQRGRITQRARADGGSTLFSQHIRQGVPGIDQGKTDE